MNRRVDFLLDVLLQIEKDNFFNYSRKQQLNEVNRHSVSEGIHHQRAMLIPEAKVEVNQVYFTVSNTTLKHYIMTRHGVSV